MARSEVTRRFIRGGARSLAAEVGLVVLLAALGYGAAALIDRLG
jgi:hypothetical protein